MNRLEEICGYTFKDKSLLEAAITHPSAAEGMPVSASYERLEFLGDSILGAIIAEKLFLLFPQFDEGKLTRLKISLVSGQMLSEVGEEIGLRDCIVMGASEQGTGSRGMYSALENVFEAVVGALYLDGGRKPAEDFITVNLKPHLVLERAERPANPKSFLQECVQRGGGEPPAYQLINTTGPAHKPVFTSVALIDGHIQGRGSGASKKESEAAAASSALEHLGFTKNGVVVRDDDK